MNETLLRPFKPAPRKKTPKSEVPGRKKRAKKDPNAPKGAMTAYLQFCQVTRPLVKAEDPELKMTEMSKVLGERWKSLSATQRKPYEDIAEKDKARYKKAMKIWKEKQEAASSSTPAVEEEEDGEEEEDAED